jgi:hypothetical protein
MAAIAFAVMKPADYIYFLFEWSKWFKAGTQFHICAIAFGPPCGWADPIAYE